MNDSSNWKRLFRLDESSRHLDRSIEDELTFHIEERIEQLVAEGMIREKAEAEARREFGGIETTRNQLGKIGNGRLRRRAGGERVRGFLSTIRMAIRSYLQRPGFALTVIIVIALGVGATTTIFSIVDGVIIKRLPYENANRLFYVTHAAHPVPCFRDWQERTAHMGTMAAIWNTVMDFTGGNEPVKLQGAMTTPEMFPLFDATAAAGRLFVEEDYVYPPSSVVLSHDTWVRHFGADPDVIGETVETSTRSVTVLGVLAEDFVSPNGLMGNEFDFWVPLDVTEPELQRANWYVLEIVGRLNPGLTIAAARREFAGIADQLAEDNPDLYLFEEDFVRPFTPISLQSALAEDVETPLLLAFGAVLMLLGIAYANVANLFLARGVDRMHEIALRYALGAGRRHIIEQLLTESAVLALIGGVIGIGIALLGVNAITLYVPTDLPLSGQIAVDLRTMFFAIGTSLLTGILFGLIPALRASCTTMSTVLKDAAQGTGGGRRRSLLRNIFVVTEISLAMSLLIVAGLLFTSLVKRRMVDPGFDTENLLVMRLDLNDAGYSGDQGRLLGLQLQERINSIPPVRAAAASYSAPFQHYGGSIAGSFSSNWQNDRGEAIQERAVWLDASPEFFTVYGLAHRGRIYEQEETSGEAIPAVISEGFARVLFGEENPVGRTFSDSNGTVLRVLGTVSDLQHWGLDRDPIATIYMPWGTWSGGTRVSLSIRTVSDPAAIVPALREVVRSLDPNLPIRQIFIMEDRISESLGEPSFYTFLLTIFALMALALAAAGIYGSMLYSVGQRRREMGVRTALGASRGSLIGLVVSQSARITLIGIAIGLGIALALSRVLEGMVFDITPTNVPTLAGVSLILGSIALIAAWIPALRASRTDPVETLRTE